MAMGIKKESTIDDKDMDYVGLVQLQQLVLLPLFLMSHEQPVSESVSILCVCIGEGVSNLFWFTRVQERFI